MRIISIRTLLMTWLAVTMGAMAAYSGPIIPGGLQSSPIDLALFPSMVRVGQPASSPPYQYSGGGAFAITILPSMTGFYTFCVEFNIPITFSPPTDYYATVNPYAANGGQGGQTETNKDYVSAATAALYRKFLEGNLGSAVAGFDYAVDWHYGQLQQAFWFLEEEKDISLLGSYPLAEDLYNWAMIAGDGKTAAQFNVQALNLWSDSRDMDEYQSMLVWGDSQNVPEPGVGILLGIGLTGVALLSLRRSD